MDNREIAERAFELWRVIRYKNGTLANRLQVAIIALLEHPAPLDPATPEIIRTVKGIGPVTVGWIVRLAQGENVESIATDVPELKGSAMRPGGGSQWPDLGNWDGSWDDIVRIREGS